MAYVGNFIQKDYRTQAAEPLPLYVYADPKYQFNGAEISANYIRTKFPGMGSITDTVNDVTSLQYHSLQLSVQRRLSKGLQMGMAYTLAKGMGMQGYDDYTANPTSRWPTWAAGREGDKMRSKPGTGGRPLSTANTIWSSTTAIRFRTSGIVPGW